MDGEGMRITTGMTEGLRIWWDCHFSWAKLSKTQTGGCV